MAPNITQNQADANSIKSLRLSWKVSQVKQYLGVIQLGLIYMRMAGHIIHTVPDPVYVKPLGYIILLRIGVLCVGR